MSIPVSAQTEAMLREKAAAAGVDVQTYASRALERIASRPSLDEILAPLRAEVQASGASKQELTDMLEVAKHETRARRRAP